jgi:hypothetical protein
MRAASALLAAAAAALLAACSGMSSTTSPPPSVTRVWSIAQARAKYLADVAPAKRDGAKLVTLGHIVTPLNWTKFRDFCKVAGPDEDTLVQKLVAGAWPPKVKPKVDAMSPRSTPNAPRTRTAPPHSAPPMWSPRCRNLGPSSRQLKPCASRSGSHGRAKTARLVRFRSSA